MKSPFPGMDPYLEQRWSDVHVTLIASIKESLQAKLPSPLRARAEERLLVEEIDEQQRAYQADVAVVQSPASSDAGYPAGATATIEPVAITLDKTIVFDRSIQIIDTQSGNRVVTAIEILSPWNKFSGRLNGNYLRKLNDYQRAGINVVEIDLLRSSRDQLPITHNDIPRRRRATYMTCVFFSQPGRWFAYPMPLREPLGAIPIPLRPQDQVIGLEMQPLIERVYVGHDDIDYSAPLNPPLPQEDATWAQEMIRTAKR